MLEATLSERAKTVPAAASGRGDAPPFMVMDVMAAAARIEATGGHVIHMEVGQPAAAAPKTALAAARAALDGGRIDYTSALGVPSLRERISRHYRETYGCNVDPGRIVVTTGSSGAFILGFLAMFEPGARVAVRVPGYPPYRHILTALGCEPVLIETSSETRHALTGEALLAAHPEKPLQGVLGGSPANPTGTMMSREALTGLMAAAQGAGIRFISDEIYHGLDYAFPAVTAAELSPQALVINSFSKYFCMTGWRGRSKGFSRISRSRCRRCRRSRLKPPSTARPRWKRSSTAMSRTASSRSKACPRRAGPNFCLRTARSISMPTSRISRPTASPSPSA